LPILDCNAGPDLRSILRIDAEHGKAEDLMFTPPEQGTAEVTESTYTLKLSGVVQGFHVRFRINRYSGDGTRALINESTGKEVEGHMGFDPITCKPYKGKPL
jgi:hypothetical protein